MKIQKNSRQVPKDKKITSNKIYSDILYSYLQEISFKDGNNRYLKKQQINYGNIAFALNLSRQTVSRKFNNLIELNLILPTKDNDEYKYMIPTIPPHEAFLIPQDTLRKMVNTLAERTITIYVYLINRWIINQEEPFDFTITALKAYSGLSIKTESNNVIITDILEILAKLGLIKYSCSTQLDKNKFKTYYHLEDAKLTL